MSPPTTHIYEVRLRKDKSGVDLISDALPFRALAASTNSPGVDFQVRPTEEPFLDLDS